MKGTNISKMRAAGAFAVTAAMLVLTALAVQGEGMNERYLFIALALAAGAGLFCFWPVKIGTVVKNEEETEPAKTGTAVKNNKKTKTVKTGAAEKIITILMMVLLPAAALCSLEFYTHVPQDLDPPILFLNLLFFWILYGICIFLSGSVRAGGIIATLIPMLFGLTNYFVVQFRSHPIVPWDFLSIRTALSVSDSYSFTFTWRIVFVLFAFIWIMLLFSKSEVRFTNWISRFLPTVVFVILMGIYVTGIQRSDVQSFFGMDTTLFTLNVLYRNNGIAAAFLGNLRFLALDEPSGYSVEKVQELQEPFQEDEAGDDLDHSNQEDKAGDDPEPSELPNIIVIMNEAFSDLSVYGDFSVYNSRTGEKGGKEVVMPFVSSIQEEKDEKSIGGEVYVSVKGGNTANTEFEFLTGNTMAFLPAGSVPYQQYINEPLPNLTSRLKNLEYQTLAIHPYNASGWDRDKVYLKYFDFDNFLSLKNFERNSAKYRGYISDKAAFDKIFKEYTEMKSGNPVFVFEVTMQNHGGYSRETPDFDIYLTLPDVSPKTLSVTSTEKYLTLMNLSDQALEDLASRFAQEDEPAVILMLGDHQPSDYITNVVRRITGTTDDPSIDEEQTAYRVPFVIWSNQALKNYDEISSKISNGISVNYLGDILMEAAGIPLTGYQQFLSDLMEQLPVVNANGLRDASGTFQNYSQNTYQELLNEYEILQYNNLFDNENRENSFYEE